MEPLVRPGSCSTDRQVSNPSLQSPDVVVPARFNPWQLLCCTTSPVHQRDTFSAGAAAATSIALTTRRPRSLVHPSSSPSPYSLHEPSSPSRKQEWFCSIGYSSMAHSHA